MSRKRNTRRAFEIRRYAAENGLRYMSAMRRLDAIVAQPDGPPTTGVFFASDLDGRAITHDASVEPNMLITGSAGTGKTFAAQTLVFRALLGGHDVHVVDTVNRNGFRFARLWLKSLSTDIAGALQVLTEVHAQMGARTALFAGPDSAHPPRIYIVVDAFTASTALTPVSKIPDELDPEAEALRQSTALENDARIRLRTLLGHIARHSRTSGISLVITDQRAYASMVPTELRNNLGYRVLLAPNLHDVQSITSMGFSPADIDPGLQGLGEGVARSGDTGPVQRIQLQPESRNIDDMHAALRLALGSGNWSATG